MVKPPAMNLSRMRRLLLLLAVIPLLARAGDSDEVVVVYNSSMPESKAVAEHYARARQVPAKQVFGFKLPAAEEISRAEFRDSLQLPLAKKLEKDGLWKLGSFIIPATNGQPVRVGQRVIASQIRYVVLCYGVPLKIRAEMNLHETVPDKMPAEMLRNEAAVDSELAWLPLVGMNFPLTGPYPNWVYGATNATLLNPTNGILLVARLDGPTPEIARGLVDKALQAERDGLWGRAYFDARNLDKTNAYFLGDEWILGAARLCRDLGFETTVDNQPETIPASFPLSHIAIYCGWYDGGVSGPFTLPKVEFMPGAFAYHLHSYSANTLHSASENWAGPLLAKGATCTMGCVYEPYLAATPNVAVVIARLVAAGFTFGEAAYAGQPVLSWQTTVVGDPLYCPFKRTPQELHAELARQNNPLLEWSYLRLANLTLAQGTRSAAVSSLLENLDLTAHSAVLTEKLGDLYSAQGKPSSAILAYQNALKLNPSPQQRIRLRLALGEKLQVQDRGAEAVENYRALLAEAPGYPGNDSISNKLAMLQPPITGTNAAVQPKIPMAIFFDTHAHLDYPDYAPDLPEVIARAQAAGISKIISIGTSLDSSARAIRLAEKYPSVYAVVGWHPTEALAAPEDLRPALRELAGHPKVVAIGETGLDYHHLPSEKPEFTAADDVRYKEKQADIFRQQMEVAAELGLNCVIHQRTAWDDTIAQMRPFIGKTRGVFHCFGETVGRMREVFAIGSLVSFTGIVTFKNAQNVRDAVAAAPLGQFMLETDCPYLAPVPYRGKRCEPAYVKEISEAVAQIKLCSLEELSAATGKTAAEFFPKL
jgi:TatD DNase family protein